MCLSVACEICEVIHCVAAPGSERGHANCINSSTLVVFLVTCCAM